MFVFSPGTFDGAPHTYISTLKGPSDPAVRARLQAGMVRQFPNVSVVDLREILQTIQGVVSNVSLAITVVGGLVLLSGILILIGAISMTKFRRVYEAAILKTLGAGGMDLQPFQLGRLPDHGIEALQLRRRMARARLAGDLAGHEGDIDVRGAVGGECVLGGDERDAVDAFAPGTQGVGGEEEFQHLDSFCAVRRPAEAFAPRL